MFMATGDSGGINMTGDTVIDFGEADLTISAETLTLDTPVSAGSIEIDLVNSVNIAGLIAVNNGYIDIFVQNGDILIAGDVVVSAGTGFAGDGNGWVSLAAAGGSILNTNGSQLAVESGVLILLAQGGIGSVENPLLTRVQQLTAISTGAAAGDIVITETDGLDALAYDYAAHLQTDYTHQAVLAAGLESYALFAGDGDVHIRAGGGLVLNNISTAGGLTLVCDAIEIQGIISGNGVLTISPGSADRTMRIGDVSVLVNAGSLNVNMELFPLTFSEIVFGEPGVYQGAVEIFPYAAGVFYPAPVSVYGGSMTIRDTGVPFELAHTFTARTLDFISISNARIEADGEIVLLCGGDLNLSDVAFVGGLLDLNAGGFAIMDNTVFEAFQAISMEVGQDLGMAEVEILSDDTQISVAGVLTVTGGLSTNKSIAIRAGSLYQNNAGFISAQGLTINVRDGFELTNVNLDEFAFVVNNMGNAVIKDKDDLMILTGLMNGGDLEIYAGGTISLYQENDGDIAISGVDNAMVTAGQDIIFAGALDTGENGTVTLNAQGDITGNSPADIQAGFVAITANGGLVELRDPDGLRIDSFESDNPMIEIYFETEGGDLILAAPITTGGNVWMVGGSILQEGDDVLTAEILVLHSQDKIELSGVNVRTLDVVNTGSRDISITQVAEGGNLEILGLVSGGEVNLNVISGDLVLNGLIKTPGGLHMNVFGEIEAEGSAAIDAAVIIIGGEEMDPPVPESDDASPFEVIDALSGQAVQASSILDTAVSASSVDVSWQAGTGQESVTTDSVKNTGGRYFSNASDQNAGGDGINGDDDAPGDEKSPAHEAGASDAQGGNSGQNDDPGAEQFQALVDFVQVYLGSVDAERVKAIVPSGQLIVILPVIKILLTGSKALDFEQAYAIYLSICKETSVKPMTSEMFEACLSVLDVEAEIQSLAAA